MNRLCYKCKELKKEEDFNLDEYAKEVFNIDYRMHICSDCDEDQKNVATLNEK